MKLLITFAQISADQFSRPGLMRGTGDGYRLLTEPLTLTSAFTAALQMLTVWIVN